MAEHSDLGFVEDPHADLGFVPEASSTPGGPLPMGAGEAVLHGAVEGIPFGQRLAAAGTAALQAGANALPESMAQKWDLAQAPASSAYDYGLSQEQAALEKAKRDQKWATRGGEALGGGLSMAVLSPFKAAQGASALVRYGKPALNAALYGGLHGAGRGRTLEEAGINALIEAPLYAALSVPAQALGEFAGPAARYVGGKAKDLAGWLKTLSIHPVPTLGKAMARIPGGKSGVGLELLQRGIGGLTKGGTAEQVGAATNEAGQVIGKLASDYDAAGGAPIDLNPVLSTGLQHASKLQNEPLTKAAGQKLENLIYDYAAKYKGAPVPASEALALKRALGDEAYGVSKQFKMTPDKALGDYGEGISTLERATDDALDGTLGPHFGQANLSFRRLLAASRAAEHEGGRATAHNIFGLLPYLTGGVAYSGGHGAHGAVETAIATHLFNKYGPQVGARTLYGLGRGMEMAPQAASAVAQRLPAAASAFTRFRPTLAGSQELSPDVAAMVAALRKPRDSSQQLAEAP